MKLKTLGIPRQYSYVRQNLYNKVLDSMNFEKKIAIKVKEVVEDSSPTGL